MPERAEEPLTQSLHQLVDELAEVDAHLADLAQRRSVLLMMIAGYRELASA